MSAMKRIPLATAAFAGLLCIAPGRPSATTGLADTNSAKSELLALHQAARRAHFERDVNGLLSTLAPDFISVRDGKIQIQSRESLRKQFTEYFEGAEFSAWDDLEPPIIRVSTDGLMAWMIVRVKVAYTKADAAGIKTPHQFISAWMSAYEKRQGKWIHVANTSTFEPEAAP